MNEASDGTLRAFGDPDDHLRLSVQIARRLNAPKEHEVFKADVSWAVRRDALDDVLRKHLKKAKLHLVDIDALATQSTEGHQWDDWNFSQQRRGLLDVILKSAERGQLWSFARPEPTAEVSGRLPIEDEDAGSLGEEGMLWHVAPGLSAIGRALVDRQCMSQQQLDEILENSSEPDSVLLSLSYDTLRPADREIACHLAVPRGRQSLNGRAGPYDWGTQVTLGGVRNLRQAGWLTGDESCFEMARSVRRFLLTRAAAEQLRSDHAVAAAASTDDLETHHHAVAAGDIALAIQTATYYGVDLRLLARELSIQEQKYSEAADLYQKIIHRFDAKDAYAWEYLAYNLERKFADAIPKGASDKVFSAYDEACQIEPNNPLYRGRWLAFKARRGDRVAPDVNRYVRYFAGPRFSPQAVSYLCERVLRRLGQEQQLAQVAEISEGSGRVLRRLDRIRPLLPG